MTDHQITLLSASITGFAPVLAVLVGLILNFNQIRNLREDIRDQFKELREDIRELRGEVRTIHGKLAEMDLEIAKLMDGDK